MGEMVGVVIGAAAVFGLAVWVSLLAEDRGQPPLPWFVAALLLPIISLLVVLVAFPRPESALAEGFPDADDAVAASAVARALSDQPHASVHQLVERTGLSEREVLSHLRALEHLGRVSRDDTGRFDLRPS